jgi:hypothetical protein
MKPLILSAAFCLAAFVPTARAQVAYHGAHSGGHPADHPTLNVNPRWKECSFQLSPNLTQAAWRQFTSEAGLVVYFRPMTDARPMGRGNFEISVAQYEVGIDASDAAWNDTFVHPDSTHWLFEGDGLKFPGLSLRAGVGAKTDVGLYVTKNPNANYGFVGGQVQQSLLGTDAGPWAAAGRLSFVTMYGPEDVGFNVVGADLLASRRMILSRWAAIAPYAGVSTFLTSAQEKSAVVALESERVLGGQAMVGASLEVFNARLSMEYNVAKVNSTSIKIGVGW